LIIPARRTEKLIGEILVENNFCSESDIEKALSVQKHFRARLGQILLNLGVINEEALLKALSIQFDIEIFEPSKFKGELVSGLNKKIPILLLKKLRIVPIEGRNDQIFLLIDDPLNLEALYMLQKIFPDKPLQPLLVSREELDSLMESLSEENERSIFKNLETEIEHLKDLASEAPAIKIVNRVLIRGIERKASDIHFESVRNGMVVRYRIDGVLHEVEKIPPYLEKSIISRLKLLSKMNISESRLPQDGRMSLKVGGKEYDIRVSSVPTKFGESIVLRILSSDSTKLELESLGFLPDHLEILTKVTKKSYGMFLTTGPTGSGKTTTLYSLLQLIDKTSKKIITIENPVEYIMDNVCQIEANPEIGLTFAAALRSILRQDPDVILVGEIRDYETAEIAVQSSLTGHLVLSTLHTNDAIGAVERMIDLGVPDYLLRSSLIGTMAQRLVRKVCPYCAEPLDKREFFKKFPFLERIRETFGLSDVTILQGKGCEECNYTGYLGRTVIAEIVEMTDEVWSEVMKFLKQDEVLTKKALKKELGIRTMVEDGFLKVLLGKTTIDEVIRVTSL